jgi:signal transduction histidine kinase/ligand-binding sensor domain-containing protein/DNA-binding response OmpR family regulator
LPLFITGIFDIHASEIKSYELRQKTVNNGLSNNTVYTIAEDKNGFLWVGTESGLNRFDSRDWKHYFFNPMDSTGLSNSKIQAILSDHLGRLWIGTAKGLNLFSVETNVFSRLPESVDGNGIPGEYIRCLYEDSDLDIWVGTSEGLVLVKYDSLNIEFNNVILGNGSEGENNIVTIYEDRQGIIWIGTGGGLFYTRNKKDFFSFDILNQNRKILDKAQIRAIIEINDILLIATENNGLFAYSRINGKLTVIKVLSDGIAKDLIFRDLFLDTDSALWIAATGGLFRIDEEELKRLNEDKIFFNSQQILENSVRKIFEDKNHGTWFGTQYNGLYYHYDDNFLFRKINPGSISPFGNSNSVVSAFLVNNDSIWIGTDGGGLIRWDRKQDRFNYWTEETGLVNNNIKCLAKDWNGNLWIGTFKGLSILKNNLFINYNFESLVFQDSRKKGSHFLSIHFDPEKKIAWLGTDGHGLVKFDPGTKKFSEISTLYSTFKIYSVNKILSLNDSTLILGTSSGLYSFNTDSYDFTRRLINIPSVGKIEPYIISLEFQDDNKIWVGTEKYGIVLYDLLNEKTYSIQEFNDFPGIVINSIQQIRENELWISTNQGLNRTRFEYRNDSLITLSSKFFSESYGVQSRQFMPRSSFYSSENELFFGGINGFNFFYPEEINFKMVEIPCYIKALSYWNSREDRIVQVNSIYPSGTNLIFKHYIRDITLNFIGINFSHPENTQYAYKFSGEGENWIELGSRDLITFNNLAQGDYKVEIAASQEPVSWEGKGTILEITILPPFWKSGFAIVIYSIIILVLLFLFYRTITKWERLSSDLKVEQVKREQEQNLHEQRIRFFTDISHELRTPLTLILSPIDMIIKNHPLSMRVLNTLQMVKQNGERMMQLINQLLDLRKADAGHLKFRAAKGNLVRFIEEIMISFRDLAISREITMDFQTRKKNIEAYYDRDKFEIIINNLLSNAIKHSTKGGKVKVSIEAHADPGNISLSNFPDGFVQIIIEDSGKGIPPDKIDRIFDRFFEADSGIKGSGIGLEITKKYIELHGGTIAVESRMENSANPGFTKFIIKLPMGRRHLKDEDIIDNYISSEDIKGYITTGNESTLNPDLEIQMEKVEGLDAKEKGNYKLIIVEDNPELREFLVQMLQDQFRVSAAENGRTGWETIINDPPDIIISDIMMPEMDGIELCRKIKTDVRTSHIPVILLSARTAITFKYEGLETGADEYITKPFQPEYLSLKIRNLLYQREMVRRKYLKDSITDPEDITLTSMDEKLLKKTIQYIHSNIDKSDLSIESLSEKLGISRVHFYRKIKSLTGVTPQEFLKTIRMKYAASLISQKKLRISEVAYMCGYKDLAYFSKSFKEFHGMSPSEYHNNTKLSG